MQEYDIVISFAGENRDIAETLARLLKQENISVFYDEFELAKLWGKDLYEYLADVYSNKAQYCLMIISEHYSKKAWTNHERQNAQARAFKENREYILPLRVDDTEIPGLPATIGYLNYGDFTPEKIVEIINQKLGKQDPLENNVELSKEADVYNLPIPKTKIKKKFSQRDKDRFLRDSFDYIEKYFEQALKALESENQHVETDINHITNAKFNAKIYVDGESKESCKIWIGSMMGSEQIYYNENTLDFDHDNSFNDSISVEDNGYEIFLKIGELGMFHRQIDNKQVDAEGATKYLWEWFVEHIGE